MNDDDFVVITCPGLDIIGKKQGIGCNRHTSKVSLRIPRSLGSRAEVQPGNPIQSNKIKRAKIKQMGQDQQMKMLKMFKML